MSNEQVATSVEYAPEGTTTFVSDSTVQLQQFNQSTVASALLPLRDQTISDFLMKPAIVASGDWSSTTPGGDVLHTIDVSSYLRSTTAIPQWAKKIEGYALVRGTAVFRLVINASPFHCGKMIMSFSPCGGNMLTDSWRGLCRSQLTQQPNVEHDCRDRTAIIKLPYIAPTEYFDLKQNQYGWGLLRVAVLAPLKIGSGGEESVSYTLFLHFEDFELAAPIVPQMASVVTKPPGKKRPSRVKAVTTSNEQQEVSSGGTLSKALASVSSVASDIGKIPSLTAIAMPVSWMARGASALASFFGWSKPLNDAVPNVVVRRTMPYMANATGASYGANFGLYHDTSIPVVPDIVGNDQDEMSFNYLKGRKAFCSSFTYSAADLPGDLLFSVSTGASMFEEGSSIVSGVTQLYRSHTPFSYVSQYFSLWRGSLVMTIKFAKTDYHSGRLLITYTPHFNITTPPNLDTSILALREIVDISGKSEIVLTLPYLIYTNYLGVNTRSGQVDIKVLNELRQPSTASASIDALVYWHAGEDFELQVPGFLTTSQRPVPFTPQVGGDDENIVDEVVGNYIVPGATLDSSSMCIGEHFTSIKQLMARYTPLITLAPIAPSTGNFGVYPYVMSATYQAADGTLTQPALCGDAISSFALGYVFFRGSVNIAVNYPTVSGTTVSPSTMIMDVKAANTSTPVLSTANKVEKFLSYGSLFNTALDIGSLEARQVFDGIVGPEVRVPYYARTRLSLIDPRAEVANCSAGLSKPNAYLRCLMPSPAGSVPTVLRSAADDFQLSYFVGFPPLWQPSS